MAIPDFQSIMLPLLQFASDQKEHSLREAIEQLAEDFALTDDERKELLPSGRQPAFRQSCGMGADLSQEGGTCTFASAGILPNH
jgi:restriction system protein